MSNINVLTFVLLCMDRISTRWLHILYWFYLRMFLRFLWMFFIARITSFFLNNLIMPCPMLFLLLRFWLNHIFEEFFGGYFIFCELIHKEVTDVYIQKFRISLRLFQNGFNFKNLLIGLWVPNIVSLNPGLHIRSFKSDDDFNIVG